MTNDTSNSSVENKERLVTLEAGHLGVVTARAGVGKSTCLVCIALEELINGHQVLHVSLDTPVSHVRASYDDALEALQARDAERITSPLRFEIERRRVIHSYLGGTFSPSKLGDAIGFLDEHMDFTPSMIVVDGYVHASGADGDLTSLAHIAKSAKVALWMSALTHREDDIDDETSLPRRLSPFVRHYDTILQLEPEGETIVINLLKKHGQLERRRLRATLDPNTRLLICDER